MANSTRGLSCSTRDNWLHRDDRKARSLLNHCCIAQREALLRTQLGWRSYLMHKISDQKYFEHTDSLFTSNRSNLLHSKFGCLNCLCRFINSLWNLLAEKKMTTTLIYGIKNFNQKLVTPISLCMYSKEQQNNDWILFTTILAFIKSLDELQKFMVRLRVLNIIQEIKSSTLEIQDIRFCQTYPLYYPLLPSSLTATELNKWLQNLRIKRGNKL